MATEAQLARECAGVAGVSFALMGTGLAGRARAHARDNVAWRRQWSQAVGSIGPDAGAQAREERRLALAYAAAGAVFGLLGVALLGAAVLRPEALAAWQRPACVGPGAALAGGVLLSVAGLALAWSKASSLDRAPAALAGLPDASRPFGERLAHASGWALSFVLSGYGLRLLREALR